LNYDKNDEDENNKYTFYRIGIGGCSSFFL